MAPQEDHERLSRKLGKEIDDLSRETERVEDEIKSVRADWRAKQHDESVPGAVVPGEDREADEAEGDEGREARGEEEGAKDRASDDEDVSGDRPDRRSST